jgi:hypothetical protein
LFASRLLKNSIFLEAMILNTHCDLDGDRSAKFSKWRPEGKKMAPEGSVPDVVPTLGSNSAAKLQN